MDNFGRPYWLRIALLVGAPYFAMGFVSGALAAAAPSQQMQFFWRLSAFILSGLVFVAHVAYERFRLRNTARTAAWHASVGAGFGGFGLALAANLHDLGSAAGYRPRMLVALVAWPLLTGAPAFIAALAIALVLGLKRLRA